MFSNRFKKDLDPIRADQNLLSRTRQKIADEKNRQARADRKNPGTLYAKKRIYIRAAAAVCSLFVLMGIGVFFADRTGFDFSSFLTGSGKTSEAMTGLPSNIQADSNSNYETAAAATAVQEMAAETAEETTSAADASGGSPKNEPNDFHDDSIYHFSDYESILTILKRSWANANDGYSFDGEKITEDMTNNGAVSAPTTAGAADMGGREEGAPASIDYSQTNIQVEGVDEADIIKNDGEYIYCILYSSLYVLDVRDPENMKVAAIIGDSFSLTDTYANYMDLFYDSDSKTLSVISSEYYESYDIVYPDTGTAAGGLAEEGIAADSYIGMYPYTEYTKLQTYDVSDPYSPKEIRTFYQDGYYLSSRRISDTVYLVTSQNFWYDGTMPAQDIMPKTSDGKENWAAIPPEDIYIVSPDYASTFTVVSAVDSRSVDVAAKTQAVAGQGTVVYASSNTLYIAATIWDESIYQTFGEFSEAQSNSTVTASAENDVYKTKILSFNIAGGTLEAKASGSVNGTLLNQYSLDEYQGNLRIATTSGGWTGQTSNNIFVLDESLDLISGLTDLAPGESIYSARFAEDRIYLVTFQQVDPFFVIDASDPTDLSVLGKLKIPGYSNYLQMLGDNTVLAIGNTTYTSGGSVIPAGLKIAVFDVTDPSDPILQSSLIYGDSYGYSDVQYNPKALLLNYTRGLIGLPVSFDLPSGDYGTEYISGYLLLHFDEQGNLTHDYIFKDIDSILNFGMCRGIYIDDTIFLVGYTEVQAYDIDTHELIDALSLYQD